MNEASSYADKEEWEAAAKMYGRVLQADPDHAEASQKRSWAQKESAAKRQFDRIQDSVKNKQWVDAYREMSTFPLKSTYYSRLAPLTSLIEVGYADAELERAKLLIEDDNRDAARQIYEGIRKQPFAKDQAEELRAALEEQAAPPTVAVPVTDAPIAVVRTAAPRTIASPSTRERIKTPIKRPVAPDTTPKLSANDLVREATNKAVRGDRLGAVEMLEQASRLAPNSPRPHRVLCGILPQLGRQREALKHCQIWAARESNPSYKVHARRQVEQVRQSLGQ